MCRQADKATAVPQQQALFRATHFLQMSRHKDNANISELDKDISTKLGGQMQNGHMDVIAGDLIRLFENRQRTGISYKRAMKLKYHQLADGFQSESTWLQ